MLLFCKFTYSSIILLGPLVKSNLCHFNGLTMSLLGLKQFLIWVIYLFD